MAPTEFAGRFAVIRRLGAGGLGLVYRVYDRERETELALKTFAANDSASVMRLKREFRALQDLRHPNLVTLHELFVDGEQSFFTMELVEGVDFLRWVRPPGGARDGDHSDGNEPGRTLHQPRLHDALAQLSRAVSALHGAGKVHRDIKPSNVLVAADGRVVLLDFGMVADRATLDPRVVGTVDYMAPEQAASQPVGPAADWYSVGTMLYQALTGDLPFRGAPLDILAKKRHKNPVDVASINPHAPPVLAELAMRLLSRDPADRPTGISTARAELPFHVGRTDVLDELDRALDQRCSILVHGEPAIGRSALLAAFIARSKARVPSLMVLSGRARAREAVAYRGLDGVIEALAQHLAELPRTAGSPALFRAFPSLRRVLKEGPDLDAAKSLAQVLAFVAGHRPVLVVIDDLQSADTDSLQLLGDMLSTKVCFVGAFRGEPHGVVPAMRRLHLGPLDDNDARLLAARLGAGHIGAAGRPWLIEELATGKGTLDDVLRAKIDSLSHGARRLLTTIASAPGPVTQDQLPRNDAATFSRDLQALQAARLIRADGARRTDPVELFHERLRSVILGLP